METNSKNKRTAESPQGIVITFEGIEGCGKSTQIALLVERLRKEGYPISTLKYYEPGGTPLADHLRALIKQNIDKPGQQGLMSIEPLLASYEMDALTQAFLFFASRAHQFHFKLAKEIAQGKIVILDRSIDSTVAYQGYAQNPSLVPLIRANNAACLSKNNITIAKTIFLDVPVAVSVQRISERKKYDRFDSQKADFFEKIRDGYHKELAFSNEPTFENERKLIGEQQGRITLVDGTETPDEISATIYALILPLLKHTKKALPITFFLGDSFQ